MKKRLFSLTDEMDEGLQEINRKTGIPISRLVRDGIQMVLAQHGVSVDSGSVKYGDPERFKAKVVDAPAQPKVILPMPAAPRAPRAPARSNGHVTESEVYAEPEESA